MRHAKRIEKNQRKIRKREKSTDFYIPVSYQTEKFKNSQRKSHIAFKKAKIKLTSLFQCIYTIYIF